MNNQCLDLYKFELPYWHPEDKTSDDFLTWMFIIIERLSREHSAQPLVLQHFLLITNKHNQIQK